MSNKSPNISPIKTQGELRGSSTPLPEYACLHCGMDLYTSLNLREHAFSADHFLQCGCCNDLLSTPETMTNHLVSFTHMMKCAQCGEMFPTYKKWRRHIFRTEHQVWFDLANLQRVGPYGSLKHLLPKDGSAITKLVDRLERERRQLAMENSGYNILADNGILGPTELAERLMKRVVETGRLIDGMDGMEIDSGSSGDESAATSSNSESESEPEFSPQETEMTGYKVYNVRRVGNECKNDDDEGDDEEDVYSYIYMDKSGKEIKVYLESEDKPFTAHFETAAAERTALCLNKPQTNPPVRATAGSLYGKSNISLTNCRRLRWAAVDSFERLKKAGVEERMREIQREGMQSRPHTRNQYKQHWRLRARNAGFAVDETLGLATIF